MATDANLDKLQNDYLSPKSLKILEHDIRAGLKKNILSTPTFIIGGETYTGAIPEKFLAENFHLE